MKTMHMIGNSHIDPVWFWLQDEGMQEIISTMQSAIERLDEYEDFKFTCGFSSYIEFIEKVDYQLYLKIKHYIKLGRIEFISGMFIESDGSLISGEFMIKQLQYGQEFTKKLTGSYSDTAFFVDAFSTSNNIAKFFQHANIEKFILNRPSHLKRGEQFWYIADDGSKVRTVKLPGEYTTWFKKYHDENIQNSIEFMEKYNTLLCPYGVGNHGGGPTIENIEYVKKLNDGGTDYDYKFSTITEFFKELDFKYIEGYDEPFSPGGAWNYSCAEFKYNLFKAEQLSVEVEKICAFTSMSTKYDVPVEAFEEIDKIIMFNQFHDIIAGTSIKEAMDEANMQVCGAIAKLQRIRCEAIQVLKRSIDTSHVEGVPLIIFNFSQFESQNIHEVEINWFCRDELRLIDADEELEYQLSKTSMTMIHKNIGGRRKIVFEKTVAPFSYAIIDLQKIAPKKKLTQTDDKLITSKPGFTLEIENEKIKIECNNKKYELSICCETDFGNPWFNEKPVKLDMSSLKILELIKMDSGLVDSYKILLQINSSKIHIISKVYPQYIDFDIQLLSSDINKSYSLIIKGAVDQVTTDILYGISNFKQQSKYLPMGRSLYLSKDNSIILENEGHSCYKFNDKQVKIMLLRSSMYGLGECEDWYSLRHNYRYMGLGEFDFKFRLHLRGDTNLSYKNALSSRPLYLQDNRHVASANWPIIETINPNIKITAIKQLDTHNKEYIFRLFNFSAEMQDTKLTIENNQFEIKLSQFQIRTFRYKQGSLKECDLLNNYLNKNKSR